MKCLVVVAHPLKDSLCHHLANYAIKELTEQGHDVTEDWLYQQGFDPVLRSEERASHYSGYDASRVKDYAKRLKNAEAVILVFPTWWFAMPAILKGWIDRVWAPGIAFDHSPDFGPLKPKLDHLQRVMVITTLGSPWWVDRLVLFQPLKRAFKIGVVGACARGVKLDFLSLYSAEKADQKSIKTFCRKIENRIRRWKS